MRWALFEQLQPRQGVRKAAGCDAACCGPIGVIISRHCHALEGSSRLVALHNIAGRVRRCSQQDSDNALRPRPASPICAATIWSLRPMVALPEVLTVQVTKEHEPQRVCSNRKWWSPGARRPLRNQSARLPLSSERCDCTRRRVSVPGACGEGGSDMTGR